MKLRYIVSLVAIVSIVVLESIALFKGIDGAMLSVALAAIGSVAGYTFGVNTTKKR